MNHIQSKPSILFLLAMLAIALMACKPTSIAPVVEVPAVEEEAMEEEEFVDNSDAEQTEEEEEPLSIVAVPVTTDLRGEFRIQVVADGRYLHLDGSNDQLLSTRWQPDDDFTRFILEPQSDSSYRIRVKAMDQYLHVDGWGDMLASTRHQANDDFTRFFIEPQSNGSYRIRVKATDNYLHEDGGGDLLVSTRYQVDDDFTRFWFVAAETVVHEPEDNTPEEEPEDNEPEEEPEDDAPEEEPKVVDEPEPQPDYGEAINNYIWSLNYDPQSLLAVPAAGSITTQPGSFRHAQSNSVIICTSTPHSLNKDLTDFAILRPTNNVVYPGALIVADRRLAQGLPTPIALPRGPMYLTFDLPGLGNPAVEVSEPTAGNVQTVMNRVLEDWNAYSAPQGYVNAQRSFYELSQAFTSKQVALSLGLNAEWVTGTAVDSQFDMSHRVDKSSVIAYYKQVFYSVSLDTPVSPADFFADHVTTEAVMQATNGSMPPAYVRSVDYGRILMIQMETTKVDTKANLELALERAMTGVRVGGTLGSSIEEIVENATFKVVAIGGGTENVTVFTGAQDLGRMVEYIQNGAVYSRANPAAPIAYTVAFMRDNRTATINTTTDYVATDCVEHANGYIKLKHDGAYIAQFEVTWEAPNANGQFVSQSWSSGDKTAGYSHTLNLPGDARNIHIRAWAATGLAWDPWGEIINKFENGPTNKCYRAYGTTLDRRWDHGC